MVFVKNAIITPCFVDSYVSTEAQARAIEGVKTWSPDKPNLYTLSVELLENGTKAEPPNDIIKNAPVICNKYEVHKHQEIKGRGLKCTSEPSYNVLIYGILT